MPPESLKHSCFGVVNRLLSGASTRTSAGTSSQAVSDQRCGILGVGCRRISGQKDFEEIFDARVSCLRYLTGRLNSDLDATH